MTNENKSVISGEELEDLLCNATVEYTIVKLKELIKKSEENSRDFVNSLLSAEENTEGENLYIDEVEEIDRQFTLHDKKLDLKSLFKKLTHSKDTKDKEYYLEEIYRVYSNPCKDCKEVSDYLKINFLKEYLQEILEKNNIIIRIKSKDLSNEIDKIIDIWVESLVTFNCNNRLAEKFQKELNKLYA